MPADRYYKLAWALRAAYPVGPATLIGLDWRSTRELRTDDELRLLALLGRPDKLPGWLNRLTRSRQTSP